MAIWTKYMGYIEPGIYDESVLNISKLLIQYLYESEIGHEVLSFGALNKILGKNYSKKDIAHSAFLLCNLRNPVLDLIYAHYSENEGLIDFEDDEIDIFLKDGIVINPETGEIDEDRNSVVVYFRPTEEFLFKSA